jgi:hypothetical protein
MAALALALLAVTAAALLCVPAAAELPRLEHASAKNRRVSEHPRRQGLGPEGHVQPVPGRGAGNFSPPRRSDS